MRRSAINVGALVLHVTAHEKVAVDPVDRIPRWKWLAHPNTAPRGRFEQCASDEYFASLDPSERFDVVFVDGLHTYEQSLRDVESSLRHLRRDGVVLAHDCNPQSAAAGGSDPDATGGAGWNGEVWRSIVRLRATRPDLEISVLDTDCGVGVIRFGENRSGLEEVNADELSYADLDARRAELLGLKPYV